MNPELLENVLACPNLPSLPAVAGQVIELTSDEEVRLDDLAEVITRDQGLSAKILRTVNSSFYGLRQPCTTIEKSLVMLGLGPVKTLALGFSLVSAVDTKDGDGFDFQAYWRRGLFAAVGAKCICEAAGMDNDDEAFLIGMLQDIGMVALYKALGTDYTHLLEQVEGDHEKLCRVELTELELQHPEIGAMLAERWKLPPQLTIPIRYHARSTAAPVDHAAATRAVAVANIAHDVLTAEPADAAPHLKRFYSKMKDWFSIETADADAVLSRINAGTKELTRLFSLDTGSYADADAVIADAQKRMTEIAKQAPRESYGVARYEGVVTPADTDPLTGAVNAKGFDALMNASFREAKLRLQPITVVLITMAGFEEVERLYGQGAIDDVAVSTVVLLNNAFEPLGGVACRRTNDGFAVIVPGSSRPEVAPVAEEFRAAVERSAAAWLPGSASASDAGPSVTGPTITAAIGLAAGEGDTLAFYGTPERLVTAASKALDAAGKGGGNLVRVFTPRIAA
jgi:two-component system cell cycle response regulator